MPEPLNLSTPLAYALAYARIGWHVFPVEANAKTPLGRLVPRGMLDATTDEATISKWWRQAPQAGVGIALHPSGLVALDIDPRNGGDATFEQLQASHGSLRSDVMAMTGGGGEHHVFVIPPGVQVSLPGTLGPGVDVKANGYIVVEPSIHPNGRQYVWEASSNPLEGVVPSPLPDWLRGAFVRRQQPQEGPRTAAGRVREGGRNNYLSRRAYALKRAGLPHSLLYQALIGINDAECEPPLEAEEVRAIADGKRVIGAEDVPANDDHPGDWTEDIPLPDEFTDAEPEPQRSAITVLDYEELKQARAGARWLVKKIVPSNAVGILFGGSGTYKTFVAIDLALRMAHGLQWMGRKTEQGEVVYLAAEGGSGIVDRVSAWYKLHRDQHPGRAFRVIPHSVNLSEDASAVKDAIAAAGVAPKLFVIDTMSQTSAAEENSATETAHYLRELGSLLRDVWQCCVLIIHHTGHTATERPRGSSALRANVDFMLGLFLDGEGSEMCTLTCDKQKDAEKFKDEPFRVIRVDLEHDEDEEMQSSLVASWVSSGGDIRETLLKEKADGRRGYMSILVDLAFDGMPAEELRKKFYEACGLEKADSRRRTFNRVLEKATKANLVGIVNEVVHVFSRL